MLRTAVLVVRRMILGSWSGSSMAKVVSETAIDARRPGRNRLDRSYAGLLD
jgi:hypothetical protein